MRQVPLELDPVEDGFPLIPLRFDKEEEAAAVEEEDDTPTIWFFLGDAAMVAVMRLQEALWLRMKETNTACSMYT